VLARWLRPGSDEYEAASFMGGLPG